MGIKGLASFLKSKYPSVFVEIPDINIYAGMKFAIDTSIFMYKFANGRVDDDRFLMNFVYQYNSLKALNIQAIYIFDGEHVGKEQTHEKRAIAKERAVSSRDEKLVALNEELSSHTTATNVLDIAAQIDKLERSIISINKQHYSTLKSLFDEHKIPYYTAIGEAEKGCAYLGAGGLVDVVVSEDYDCLPCGAPILLKNLGSSKNSLIELRLNTLLEQLELSYVEFVDFCILCGSDFNTSLPKIGPVSALAKIKKHRSIEGVLLATGHGANEELMSRFNYQQARRNFMSGDYQLTSEF